MVESKPVLPCHVQLGCWERSHHLRGPEASYHGAATDDPARLSELLQFDSLPAS
jgi:hypothetical protein